MTGDIPLFDVPAALSMLPALLYAARLTALAAILGFALALIFGLVAFLMGRRARRVTRFVRGTPLLVQLYFTYYLLPSAGIRLSALTGGVLVIGLHFGCYVAEVYRAGFEAVPPGQREAATALGLPWLLRLRLVVLPQALRLMLPALGNYLIAIFKETPLLSALGVPEMMMRAQLIGAETFQYLEVMTLVGVIFFVMSTGASILLHGLERRMTRTPR
jgi:polar amino acid transport system permease protein